MSHGTHHRFVVHRGVFLLLAFLLLRVSFLQAAVAHAQTATEHFDEGLRRLRDRDYVTAVAELELACGQAPKPTCSYNLARAYEGQGASGDREALRRAVDHYRRYLEEYQRRHHRRAPNEATVTAAIRRLEKVLAAASALPAGSTVPPRVPRPEAAGEDRPIRGDEGPPRKLTPLFKAPPAHKNLESRRRAAKVLLILGGIVAAAGAGCAIAGQGLRDTANDRSTLGERNDQIVVAGDLSRAGAVLLGAGGATLVAGVASWPWRRGRSDRLGSRLWVTPSGLGMALGGTFE